jgi:hypothetical protein
MAVPLAALAVALLSIPATAQAAGTAGPASTAGGVAAPGGAVTSTKTTTVAKTTATGGPAGISGTATVTTTTATPPATVPAPASPAAKVSGVTLTSTTPAATGKSSGKISDAALAVAILAGLIALACLIWAIFRFGAFEPHWLLSLRHSLAEGGFRASATWAEFGDWIRLGR